MDTEYDYSYRYSRNPMATAAVVLGIASMMTCLFFYISVPCGAMAALCAILSRGRNPMPGKSKLGIVCGVCGMGLSLMLTVASVWMVLTNAEMRTYLETYLQYYLGDMDFDLDNELESLFPPLKEIFGDEDNTQNPPFGADEDTDADGFFADDAGNPDRGNAIGDNAPEGPSSGEGSDGRGNFI